MDQSASQVQATAASGHAGVGQPSTPTASLGTAAVQPAPAFHPAGPSNPTFPGNVDGYTASSMPQGSLLGAFPLQASQPQMAHPQVQPLMANLGQGPRQMQYQRPAFQHPLPAQPPGYVRAPQQQQYRAPYPTSAYAAQQQAMYNKVQHQVAGAAQQQYGAPQATTGLPAQLGRGIPAAAVPQFRPGYLQPGMSVGIPAQPGMVPAGATGRPRLPGSMSQHSGSMAPGTQQGWRDPAFPTSAQYLQPGRPPVTTAAAVGVRPTASTPMPRQPAPTPPSAARKPGTRGPAKNAAQAGAGGKKHCNCKNSRCLKLYCECFASGRYCDDCNCVSCCNNRENEKYRQAAVETILDRNPNAFRPKIQEREGSAAAVMPARHNKGCNCKKSGCLKKYCECFQASIYCSENCKCVDCKNFNAAVGPGRSASIVPTQKRTKTMKVGQGPAPTPGAQQEQPGSFTAALNDAMADRAGDAAQVPTPGALTETMREIVRHNGIEEMASLLLLVAEEEVDSRRSQARSLETGASEGSGHSSAAADATGEVDMSEADQDPLVTERQPATQAPDAVVAGTNGVPGISALYKAQEHAVLQEFQSFLAKLVERVSKKAAEQAVDATSQQAAASPKQLHTSAASPQQQHSDRMPLQSQHESPALNETQGSAMQQSTARPVLPHQMAEQTGPVALATGLQGASQQLPPPIGMPGSGPADLAQQPQQPSTAAMASAAAQP